MAMANSVFLGSNLLHGYSLVANKSSLISHTAISSHKTGKDVCIPCTAVSMSHNPIQRSSQGRQALKATKVPDMPTSRIEETPIRTDSGNIPLIDMEKMRNNGEGRTEELEEIRRACEEWGLFYVVNHGIAEEVIEDIWEAYRAMMAYWNGLSTKDKAERTLADFPSEIREQLLSNMDAVSILKALSEKRVSVQLPPLNPKDGEASPTLQGIPHSVRAQTAEFYKAIMVVAKEIMEALSESMGLPKDTIYKVTGSNDHVSSLVHYYEPSLDTSFISFQPHKDPSTLTILLLDPFVIGLQVLKENHWIDVKPMDRSLVVIVGRVVEAFTNGKYKSCVHRVTSNSETSRSSIASFFRPSAKTIIEPFPQFIDDQNPNQYPAQSIEDLRASNFTPAHELLKNILRHEKQ